MSVYNTILYYVQNRDVSMRYHKVHHLIICPKQRCFYALSQGTPSYNMSKIKDVSMRYHKVHHLIICPEQRCFYALSQGTPSYNMFKTKMFLCPITRYTILYYAQTNDVFMRYNKVSHLTV